MRVTRAINFAKLDMRNSVMKQNKLQFQKSFMIRQTHAKTHKQKQLDLSQMIEVVILFSERVNDVIKRMIVPVLYKTLIWFYSPAIDPTYLNGFREDLIITLTDVVVNGRLAEHLLSLHRFGTLKEEVTLAARSFVN